MLTQRQARGATACPPCMHVVNHAAPLSRTQLHHASQCSTHAFQLRLYRPDHLAAERVPSDALNAAIEAVAAATAARAVGLAVEPAVPQPITPPVVASAPSLESASHLPPAGAWPASAGGKEASPLVSAGPGRPTLAAAYASALASSDHPAGPASLGGAVEEWQGALDAAASTPAAAEQAGAAPRQLTRRELQARMERLRALRVGQASGPCYAILGSAAVEVIHNTRLAECLVPTAKSLLPPTFLQLQEREERLLAAFEPAGER